MLSGQSLEATAAGHDIGAFARAQTKARIQNRLQVWQAKARWAHVSRTGGRRIGGFRFLKTREGFADAA